MGIEAGDMRSLLRAIKHSGFQPAGRMLVLGDAVIHFSVDVFQTLAREEGVTLVSIPKEKLTPEVLGFCLGFERVDTLDINGRASIYHNLQENLPEILRGKFNLVIDAGVLFWCFEPGEVIKNILRLCKTNGLLFHITALSGYYGRGYYNIHPRLFEDFYLSNSCEFVLSSYRTKPRMSRLQLFAKRLGLLPAQETTTWSDAPGSIYLGKTNRYTLQFSTSPVFPESDTIPNNMVSTFACRKLMSTEPKDPVQIC